MRAVSDRTSNPFGLSPPCDEFVPGYGDPDADFHVIGDHPGVHGGTDSGIPFTDRPWSEGFFDALAAGGLVDQEDEAPDWHQVNNTFLSYLHLCVPEATTPTEAAYAKLEPLFDAELRAITADVLLPVGSRATRHVLRTYTARDPDAEDVAGLHATEIAGSGWLVVPVADPGEWGDGEDAALSRELRRLRESDYRQRADLGRFVPDDKPYYVR